MNKSMQKERMKRIFIDAAKEMLLNEGVEYVTVRKVGEVTGYSYATIYNYFRNLEHLLWAVGIDFVLEIAGIFENDIKKDLYTIEDIKRLSRKYIDYHFANPNVFRFFFFNQTKEPPEEIKQELVKPGLENILIRTLENLAGQNVIEMGNVLTISSLIMNSIHGMLLMYFSKKREIAKQEIYIKLDEMITFLLKA